MIKFHFPDEFSDRCTAEPNFNLVNKDCLDKILKVEVFVNSNGQLRAVHLILAYAPISSIFQAPKCVIRARDPRLHRISVTVLGFLLPGPKVEGVEITTLIPEGIPKAGVLSQQRTVEATTLSRLADVEEGEMLEVADSEDEFEVFSQALSPEISSPDLGPLFSPIIDEMGIQCKPKSNLLDLIKSQHRKAVHTKPPTPPPVLPSQAVDLKRKREPKGKEAVGARQSLPPHEDDVQKASKQARTGQRGTERDAKKRSDLQVGSQAWLSIPMLNGEPLLANASIRNFQGGVVSYVADVVEQALLLPEDIVELRVMRRHEVFLSLKRYLTMVCLPSFFLTYSFHFRLLTLVSFFGRPFKPLFGLMR